MYSLNDLEYRFSKGDNPKEAFMNMKSKADCLDQGRYFIVNSRVEVTLDTLDEFLGSFRPNRVRNNTMYCIILGDKNYLFFNIRHIDPSRMDSEYIYRHALNIRDRIPISSNAVKILMQISSSLRNVGYASNFLSKKEEKPSNEVDES